VIKFQWLRKLANEEDDHARLEECVRVFERERIGLQELALLLTGNADAVGHCLSRAFRDCISSSAVSKDWVLRWIRRLIIRNAINLVMNPGEDSLVEVSDDEATESTAFPRVDSPRATADSDSILNLPEFERLVYVICVLERYSMYDCALLLGRSLRDVNEVRQRVGDYFGQPSELNDIAQRFATIHWA